MRYLTKLLPSILLTVFIILLTLSFHINGYTQESNVIYDYEPNRALEKKKQKPSQSHSRRNYNNPQKRRRIIRRPRYYPIKKPGTAAILSTIIPGMGQSYAGRPGKGVLFLISEIALFGVAGFNFDRADYYDYYSDRYNRFYDEYSDSFLTYKQGYVESKKYNNLGMVFLLSALGVHVWNIFDAAETARDYNKRHGLKLGFEFHHKDGMYLTLGKQF